MTHGDPKASSSPGADLVPADIDRLLTSEDFRRNPYPAYERLRDRAPVHWSESAQAWMLFRYQDCLTTMRDVGHFSNRGRQTRVIERLPVDERVRLAPLLDHFSVGLIASDPPDHTRLRNVVSRAFTPRVVQQLRPRVEKLVNEMLDAVESRGSMDLVADLAYPLPATVIAELLGAPPEDRDQFREWSDGIVAFAGTGKLEIPAIERSQANLLAMRAYLVDLRERRRAEPRDDLISLMVAAETDEERLTEAEFLSTCVTFLTAGHETTTNLIANGMLLILERPDVLDALRSDPSRLDLAVEEFLRFESPLQRNPRRIAEEMEIEGHVMRPGDLVFHMLGSANRDPAQFAQPNDLDIGRYPNKHMAFGFGIHFCLGAPLARLEAPIAFRLVLERLDNVALAVDRSVVAWKKSPISRGPATLPLTFSRRNNGGSAHGAPR